MEEETRRNEVKREWRKNKQGHKQKGRGRRNKDRNEKKIRKLDKKKKRGQMK